MDYKTCIRNRLDVSDRLEGVCHPLSGYIIKVFLDAFELGSVWGSITLERIIKPNAGYYYAHGFGLHENLPDQLNITLIMESANLFWGVDKTTPPEALARGEPPQVPKIKPHEEGYIEAQAKYQEKLREYAALSEKFYEAIYIKEDVDVLLERCHELFSRDLFAHISKHRDDEAERRKYAVHFESTGETFNDSPYAIKFDPQLIYKKCKYCRRLTRLGCHQNLIGLTIVGQNDGNKAITCQYLRYIPLIITCLLNRVKLKLRVNWQTTVSITYCVFLCDPNY